MFSNFPLLLAPMEDVTDSAFRSLCKGFGADVVCSEFIAADALIRHVPKSFDKIYFTQAERPYGVQIFGNDPDIMAEAAQIVETYKPDFIDLNFGCPVKKVVSKGGGAALLNDIPRMLSIAKTVVKAVKIPVTAKTRLGWDTGSIIIETLAEQLQETGIAALAIHARTKSQLYGGTADWTCIGRIKNNPRITIPIFGNGDIDSPQKALEYRNRYGVDGIMIGRATVGNPWIFKQTKHLMSQGSEMPHPDLDERIMVCKDLVGRAVTQSGGERNLLTCRRHYSGFFKNLPHFKNFRLTLLTATDTNTIFDTLDAIKAFYDAENGL